MNKKIFLVIIFSLVASLGFSETDDVMIKPKTFSEAGTGMDAFTLFGTEYQDDKSVLICMEYAMDFSRPGSKAYWVQYNNPYEIMPRDGAQDIILLYKDKITGKYYVGHYSIITHIGYSYAMVALEFDDWFDAVDTFYLWMYMKYLQSTNMTEVHFIPNMSDFWWDENGDYIYANIPKDMIDANYNLYKSRGYFNAFTDNLLLMDDVWHDLSNGKTYKRGGNTYSASNGKLYCNGSPAHLQHDINKMIRIYKYSNPKKYLSMLRNGIGYYYCDRCSNNPYDPSLRPIEMFGSHYQDTDSKNLHNDKVAGITAARMFDFDWHQYIK